MIKNLTILIVFIATFNYNIANNTVVTTENSGITKWLIDNKDDINLLIEETTKKSKTVWIKDSAETDTQNAKVLPPIKPNENAIVPTVNIPQQTNTTTTANNISNHKVKINDTLYSIAKLYGTSIKDIEELNSFTAKDLKANTTIKVYNNNNIVIVEEIPTNISNNSAPIYEEILPKYKYYKVVTGDTLSIVAKKHNMNRAELVELNNLKKDAVLSVDSILKVNSNYNDNNKDNKDFLWPVVGKLLKTYGPQSSGVMNEGINIATKNGEIIKASQDGIISYVGQEIKGFGNLILMQHQNSYITAYAHLDSILVKKGDVIKQGDIIGKSGKTGGVIQPQLHFEIRKDIKPLDPLDYLNSYR